MEVKYRELFLRDLKKLRRHAIYPRIHELVFMNLPQAETLREITGVKAMSGYRNRYRILIGSYRIGIEAQGGTVEVMRVLHRREFYRYFP